QLGDAAADQRAGVRTFVVKQGPARAKMMAAWLALPLELLGLAALLWQLAAGWPSLPLLALGGYAALAWFRGRVWQQPLVVAAPRLRGRILLNDYYEVWYPLALLLTQALRYPTDGWVLGLHGLLFATHISHTLRDGAAALDIVGRRLLRLRG
ncbi:MAG: hypothetical protein M3Y54_18185, partial [Bacteroidota bacterium]|nr:hypothetical protein [Bacteroidota bacterium]